MSLNSTAVFCSWHLNRERTEYPTNAETKYQYVKLEIVPAEMHKISFAMSVLLGPEMNVCVNIMANFLQKCQKIKKASLLPM